MILVNRENPTLNGVDYHNVFNIDWNGLPLRHWTDSITRIHPKQLPDFEKICEGISLKCVAPFGFLSNIYLYAVSYFIQQIRVAPGRRNHNAHCRVHKSPLLIQLLINFNSLHTSHLFSLISVTILFCHVYTCDSQVVSPV
jgi:hypothetical protein